MSKHTAGPWKWFWSGPDSAIRLFTPDDKEIAITDKNNRNILNHKDFETNEANARLIAAAPEMLDTLQYVASYLLSSNDNADVIKMVEDARDVVKKATGEGMG